jgi:spore coat protein A
VTERRALLRWGLTAAFGVALPAATAAAVGARGRAPGAADRYAGPPVGPVPGASSGAVGPSALPTGAFTVALPVPAVLRPTSTAGGVDRYEIRQRPGRQPLRPGPSTTIWGYNGTFPGPTIHARRGRPVEVTHRNELDVPTVVHLHGGIVAPDSDGYPTDLVLPAGRPPDPLWRVHGAHGVAGIAEGSRAYRYPNDQPAATLWYHDHRMGFTGPQMYRGLAGFYLIGDEVEDALPLPHGDRDLPLMIADRTLRQDGSLFYPSKDPSLREPGVTIEYHQSGMLGDTTTVNGVAWPYLEVDAALYRLRVLNASNARPYELELDPPPPGGHGLVQIGSDVGLLHRPVRHDAFLISPGERYDLLIDFSAYPPGTKVLVKNNVGEGAAGYVMRFDVARKAADAARIPDSLAPDPGPLPAGRVADRRFSLFSGPEMTGLPATINLKTFDAERVDARPTLGSTEIWDVTADPTHPVHVHLGHFRVLSRDGKPPLPQDAGFKDTVFVPEGGIRLAVTFTGHRGKYVFHCHNLEHGDAGMMTNVEVV